MHVQQRMQDAGWSADVERLDSLEAWSQMRTVTDLRMRGTVT